MTWSRCTGRPTSSSCCGRDGSGSRWTVSPGRPWPRWPPTTTAPTQRHREVRAELEELTGRARERAQEAEDLRRGLAEIERLEPAAGEDVELRAEEERLANADGLHTAASAAHDALLGDPSSGSYDLPDAVSLLATATQALEAVAAPRPGAGRAGGPAVRGGLPGLRRRRRTRLVRGVGRGGPGPAGRGAAAARRPDPADPQLRDRRRTPPAARAGTWPPCWTGPGRPPPGWASWTATTTGSPAWPRRPSSSARTSPSWRPSSPRCARRRPRASPPR